MNLRSSLRLNAYLVTFSTGAALVACGGSVSPSSSGSSSSSSSNEGTTASASLALTADVDVEPAPVGACTFGRDGARTDQPDLCAGSGSSRIVVTYRDGFTCAGAMGVPVGGLTDDGQTKSYLFASAPAIVRERYCVFAGGAGLTSDAAAERVVASLCASPEVAAVTRDCSGHIAPAEPTSSSSPDLAPAPAPSPSHAAGKGAPASARASSSGSGDAPAALAPLDDYQPLPHGCDVCATVAASALYVSLPPSFVAPAPNTPMVVRFSAAATSDLVVYPPALTQTFVVGGVAAPSGSDVTIYPPGSVPDPKPR